MERDGTLTISRWAALRTVSRNPLLSRSMRGSFTFSITEQGCWLAILLFAFNRGGVGEVGWVAVLLLLPAALLAPLVAVASDAFPRHIVLTTGYALVATTTIGVGAAMLADASIQIIYGLAIVFSVLMTFGGPTMAAIIPTAATTADELTAANMATGVVETAGRLIGPLLAGAILTVASPGAVVVWIGGLMALGALSTIGTAHDELGFNGRHPDDPDRLSALVELTAGLRLLRRDPQVRTLTGAIAMNSWIAGALDVGAATIAIDVLRRDNAAVSVLLTGYGAGGLIGSAASFAYVGRRRLARSLAGAAIVMCATFAVIGWTNHLATATFLLVFVGAGVTLTSVAGRTMLQGLTPDDTLARLFGVLEALKALGLAFGGLTLSLLAVRTSVPTAFAIVGGAGLVGLALMWPRLASIDRARHAVGPDLLRIVRSTTIFSPLPPYAIEQVMNGMVREHFDSGEALMRKGDLGDRMCLLTDGHVEVSTGKGGPTQHGPGAVFGEIALLHDVPRTATVTAGDGGVTVYWMDADSFLDAVNRVPRSRARAEAEAGRRIEQ